MSKIERLRELQESGCFHHATYRNVGTLWEGLWIYERADNGFNGYAPAFAFFKDDADLKAAEDMTRSTGVSLGAYGHG